MFYSSIPCAEEFLGQSESWSEKECSATVTLRVDWSMRHALVADILGNRKQWPHGGKMWAKSASVKPVACGDWGASPLQIIPYQQALVDITYSSEGGEEAISESLEPTAEFLTLDYRRFRWGSVEGDPLTEDEAPGQLMCSLTLNRTHFNVPSVPNEILTMVGHVNEGEYTSNLLGLSFEAETLLFQPGSSQRSIDTTGEGVDKWTIGMKFMYKPNTWNKFWRAKTQEWTRIYAVTETYEGGGGEPIKVYPVGDFSAMLF